jgi:hypothetical protein
VEKYAKSVPHLVATIGMAQVRPGGAVPVFEDCKFVGKSVLEIKDAAACTLLTLNLFELALPGVMRQFLKQSDPEELLGRPN